MTLHPASDQVDIDQLSTALACMILHRDLAPEGPARRLVLAGLDENAQANTILSIDLARQLWHSETQLALANAEATRCFDC